MNRRPLQPLDAEEAALAEQLARLGPHGEPSPRLDARILAAAHDAVSEQARPRRRSRWPLGLGVAASALLAVGIAWQLRPVHESPLDREFAAADVAASGAAAADSDAAAANASAEAADTAAVAVAPPAPASMVLQEPELPANAAPSAVYNPPLAKPALRQPAQELQRRSPAVSRRSTAAAADARIAEAPPLASAAESDASTLDTVSAPSLRYAAPASAPPPPPPAPAASVASADRNARTLGGVVADPETYAEIAAQREQARAEHARNAAASAERVDARARRASEASSQMQRAIAATPADASAADAPGNAYGPEYGRNTGGTAAKAVNGGAGLFSPGVTRNSLKRTDLQLPVAEDTKLDADDWLERIRLRRDLGDRASAVESLLRFRQAHPFQKTPEDLQELLAE
ncbi:hypothetical protein [Pseudoxanthomonas indica]|uniref:Uncharacterized protein n=1 Tax=Pseudoxanthomonas indica TaxID=428993 RepID=A0A1T5LV99_9GAMM|nr:hypothetical protein [Pseudoxanthomonas indica]GGD39903.1 hypothetical protein GCM10007235_09980 [Pseudoxanthomonas indica]SKC79764.1 hypothetical protein SAMN06296058_3125 [Pseudoxanthomonas indica]